MVFPLRVPFFLVRSAVWYDLLQTCLDRAWILSIVNIKNLFCFKFLEVSLVIYFFIIPKNQFLLVLIGGGLSP